MKLNKSANELLKRYLLAVQKELSGPERADITAEIETYIYDTLEELYGEKHEVSQQELEVVLKEMGSPRKVAGQYAPQRYLIGPRLFPVYSLVLKIIVLVVAGALTLSMIISNLVNPGDKIWLSILELLGNIWSGSLATMGVVTLVFAIIERATLDKEIEEIEELQELKIADLPELPEEQKEVNRIGESIEILLGIIGILFFTYVLNTNGFVPYFVNPSSPMEQVRLFTENYVRIIPFILALTGIEIARNITLMVQGYHSALTNWWDIASKCANVVMLFFVIGSLPIVEVTFLKEIVSADTYAMLESLTNTGLGIAMGLGIFGNVIEIIQKAGREIANPTV